MAPTKHLLHLFQRNAVASGWSYPHLSKGSLIRRRGNVQLFGVVFASSAASNVSSSSSSSAATTTTNYFDILGVEVWEKLLSRFVICYIPIHTHRLLTHLCCYSVMYVTNYHSNHSSNLQSNSKPSTNHS
jgi:hypothetical protein